jgi:hypothetical protein
MQERKLSNLTQESNQIEKIIREFDDLRTEEVNTNKSEKPLFVSEDLQPYVRSFIQFFLKPEYKLSNVTVKLGANESENTITVRKDASTGIYYAVMEVNFQFKNWMLMRALLEDIKSTYHQTAIVGIELKASNAMTLRVIHIQSVGDSK